MPGDADDHQCGATSGPTYSSVPPGDVRTRVAAANDLGFLAVNNRRRSTCDQARADNRQDLSRLAPVPMRRSWLVG